MIDLTDRLGGYATSAAQSLIVDWAHLNAAGYAEEARAMLPVLTA